MLDAMGVIYRHRSAVRECLLPFAAGRGCRLGESEVRTAYLACTTGAFPSAVLWERLEVRGRPEVLDEELVRGQDPAPGAVDFLGRMRRRGVRVACISNDVAEWSAARRRLHGVEPYVDHWTVSGEVGVRKPDPEVFERFARDAGVDPRSCLFADDRVPNLDAARGLGFSTVLFGPGGGDFEDLERLLDQGVTLTAPRIP